MRGQSGCQPIQITSQSSNESPFSIPLYLILHPSLTAWDSDLKQNLPASFLCGITITKIGGGRHNGDGWMERERVCVCACACVCVCVCVCVCKKRREDGDKQLTEETNEQLKDIDICVSAYKPSD